MNGEILFYIIIGVIAVNYIKEEILSFFNVKHFNDPIPDLLSDVYDVEEYKKSQDYKKAKARFSFYSGLFSIIITLLFFLLDGVPFVDTLAKQFTSHTILQTLVFFGIVSVASSIIQSPFGYYNTFVLEERFGFNKTTIKTYILDKVKGIFLGIILGGGLLYLITWLYLQFPSNFWWYTWIVLTVFSVFMNMFYSSLIVPLFNKQTPLEDGELKEALFSYANKVGFQLDKIFVIDGSKRSTKANAYFSGLGPKKRIVLYDTLINDLSVEEIVAVFAHEVGHFKRKHIVFNLIATIALSGLTLYLLGLLLRSPLVAEAFKVSENSFHIGLIAFGILYSPISEFTGVLMNILSRKFEYQADDYAKETYEAKYLVSSLKQLSKNSLSNLTPHKAYVFFHYSHPALLSRVQNLLKNTKIK